MNRLSILEAGFARFNLEEIAELSADCRPRILVVADGGVTFLEKEGFGLWRFLHSLLNGSGMIHKPVLTLAYRGRHLDETVTIGSDRFEIKQEFDFTRIDPPVLVDNYDQLWLFGKDDGESGLSDDEMKVVANFMNSGGGVFAAGDHSDLGRKLCGSVPRVRHMRNWKTIPMGAEEDIEQAIKRIDTVVNPGLNNEFQFYDQADNIPQRIYPNYTVKRLDAQLRWQATVHPLLKLPGAPDIRTGDVGSSNFMLDIDVLPDHPHESVCYAVTGEALNQKYKESGLDFYEFPLSCDEPKKRLGAEIVAFAVSGGRSVYNNGIWKPPVTPQMFGVISAYNGRKAQPYPKMTQPPGRIVCDSSWHHHLNLNLDGTGSACKQPDGQTVQCSGLGTWSGSKPGEGTFTPSPDLEKIFVYYRNTVSWLQPANRALCTFWWTLVALRYHPLIIEELLEAPRLLRNLFEAPHMETARGFVGLGLEASRIVNLTAGVPHFEELAVSILLSKRKPAILKVLKILSGDEVQQTYFQPEMLLHGAVGGILAFVATVLPESDVELARQKLREGYETRLEEITTHITQVLALSFVEHNKRVSRTIALSEKMATLLKLDLA